MMEFITKRKKFIIYYYFVTKSLVQNIFHKKLHETLNIHFMDHPYLVQEPN